MTKLPSGTALNIFETLDSTSAEAKRQAASGGPSWFLALRQTAGYGRRGRAWEQESGDFAGSLLFRPPGPRQAFGQFSFVAAIAVHEAISTLITDGDLRIKWPNDILINGAKTAGLLLEMVQVERWPVLILGVGVNMISKPEGLSYPATRLLDHGLAAPPAPEAFAAAIDANFWAHTETWRKEGFAPIRRAWLNRAAGLGEEITVRLPEETVSGIFEDIDESGALILHFGGQTRIISAGDVYFGAAGD